ncbi:MAG: hypothetical protein DCC67_19470 [Planctomycetota bacterium]|nr:MAG: hypothetical protein DCC67_19470 [Planctomycetota bacterium]
MLRGRLLAVVSSWFASEGSDWRPLVLDNPRLDLAVAQGAAYYGLVRRGEGVGIAATLARSYYIGVAGDKPRAVCLAPGNAVAGQDYEIANRDFILRLAEPAEFPLYVSSTRLVDPPGALVDVDPEELTPLPPIRTVLHAGRKQQSPEARVRLHAHLTEIGVLELSCREADSPRAWRLQFDVRSTTQTDVAAHESAAEGEGFLDERALAACRRQMAETFGPGATGKPAELIKGLADSLELPKHQWPTSVLRRLWEMLMDFEAGRRRSAAHEARWLNLLGYALRPGYGFAVDDWRVAQTWRAVSGKIAFAASQSEALVLWRRISGGLTRGQQQGLAEPLLPAVRALRRRFVEGGAAGGGPTLDATQSAEAWRLLGSLELLPVGIKIELGDAIVELLPKRKLQKSVPTMLWALGRVGQRAPLYGPLNTLVPAEVAARWLEAILRQSGGDAAAQLAAMQLARKTDDRHRDVEAALGRRVAEWLEQRGAPPHFIHLVRTGGALDEEERGAVFGESLPAGLRLG